MKNILFVMPSLGSGGAEKSLVNLLNLIDYEKYAVDLLLFKREGLFCLKFLRKYDYYSLQILCNMLIKLIEGCLAQFQVLKL